MKVELTRAEVTAIEYMVYCRKDELPHLIKGMENMLEHGTDSQKEFAKMRLEDLKEEQSTLEEISKKISE